MNATAPNYIINALDNLANATTASHSLVDTQAVAIKSQQLTIAETTTTNAKLQTIIESLTKKS